MIFTDTCTPPPIKILFIIISHYFPSTYFLQCSWIIDLNISSNKQVKKNRNKCNLSSKEICHN